MGVLIHVQYDVLIGDVVYTHAYLPCTILHIKGFIRYLFTDSKARFVLTIKCIGWGRFFSNTMSPTLN